VAEPQWFLRSLHELEPQGSHVRFRTFSSGSGLRNPRVCPTYGDSHHDAHRNEHFNAYTDADTNAYTNSNSVSSIAYTDAKAWTDTAAAPNSATAPVIATLAARLKQLLERGAAARTNYNSTQTATLRIGNAQANFRKKLYVRESRRMGLKLQNSASGRVWVTFQ